MDSCMTGIVVGLLIMFLFIGFMAYLSMNAQNKPIEANNKAKRDYVNSVVPSDGKAEENVELMSQMRPSDAVVKYVDLKCTANGKQIHGFIAVTQERLIFKAITAGDHTESLNSGLGNNRQMYASFRFDMKEETANIPIKKVTSMSTSVETVSLDATGCGKNVGNGQGGTVSAHVLTINAQGVIYKLFLGTHGDVATEFSRTFTTMQYDDEE